MKTHRRYLLYRVYAPFAIVAWNAEMIHPFGTNDTPRHLIILVAVLVPALFLSFNLMALRFPFSAFGAFEQTPFPAGEPLQRRRAASGMVGLLHATAPFFTWYVFREGVGFRCLGVGKAFIPVQHIQRTKRRLFGGFTLWHDSPEVRSPLVIPSSALHRALTEVLGGATQRG